LKICEKTFSYKHYLLKIYTYFSLKKYIWTYIIIEKITENQKIEFGASCITILEIKKNEKFKIK